MNLKAKAVGLAFGVSALALTYSSVAQQSPNQSQGATSLPYPDPQFHGQIGRTTEDSKADFPKQVTAPSGAPNVLLILTDDVGFGAASTFGGPIPTPTLDALAARGVKYNRFNTTADPTVFENTNPVEPKEALGGAARDLDADLADKAVHYIQQQHSLAPDKPFFVYYAPGATHAPHHVPQDWIAKFKGKFDQGWDKLREETFARQKSLGVIPADSILTPRPSNIPAWDSLDARHKQLYARMAEIYAAYLAYDDDNIGRVIGAVKQAGELDNTLIIFIEGDNGGSAEGTLQGTTNEIAVIGNGEQESFDYLYSIKDQLGGPLHYNHMPVPWSWAFDTPFQWTKRYA